MPIKKRVREILEVANTGDRASRWFDWFLLSLISINVIALVLGTMNELFDAAPQAFDLINSVSVAIFTVEYLLRVWSCTADPRYSGSIKGRLRFMLSPLMLIDLLSILPFFVLLLYDQQALDLRAFRALRLVARAARLTRYSPGFHTLAAVIEARKYELLTVVAVLVVMLVLAASLMYFAEKEAQPEKFASIPAAMWWRHHHPDHCRLRGCGAGNRPRPDNRRVDSNSRHRILRPARRHTGVEFLGANTTPPAARNPNLPPLRRRDTRVTRGEARVPSPRRCHTIAAVIAKNTCPVPP